MGDLPLYVGDDSADVYEYRKCFQLDDKFYPKFVSGASPDYFSKDGQTMGTSSIWLGLFKENKI